MGALTPGVTYLVEGFDLEPTDREGVWRMVPVRRQEPEPPRPDPVRLRVTVDVDVTIEQGRLRTLRYAGQDMVEAVAAAMCRTPRRKVIAR